MSVAIAASDVSPASDGGAGFSAIFGKGAGSFALAVPRLGQRDASTPEIDPDYVFDTKTAIALTMMLRTGRPGILVGEPGTGKTSAVEQLAAQLGCPLSYLACDAYLTRTDLIGGQRLVPGPDGRPITAFSNGVLPLALQQPGILLIDEWDQLEPELAYALQAPLTRRPLVLFEDGARRVPVHPECRIIATANTRGLAHGDEAHHGLAPAMSPAFRDRFSIWHEMPRLTPGAEAGRLVSRAPGLKPEDAALLVNFGRKLRARYASGQLTQTCTFRMLIGAAELFVQFAVAKPAANMRAGNLKAAVDLSIAGRFPNTEAALVKSLAEAELGLGPSADGGRRDLPGEGDEQ